jgi:DNA-binding HxlR family transcriptional regulator
LESHEASPSDGQDDGTFDPALADALLHLRDASQTSPDKPWSLAKLSKRTGMPMSTLRRRLTLLEAAGLVVVTLHDDGNGSAALSQAGQTLCAALFPASSSARP